MQPLLVMYNPVRKCNTTDKLVDVLVLVMYITIVLHINMKPFKMPQALEQKVLQ